MLEILGMLEEVVEVLGDVEVVRQEEEGVKIALLDVGWDVMPAYKRGLFANTAYNAGKRGTVSSSVRGVHCVVKMVTALIHVHITKKTGQGNRAEAESNPRGKIPNCKTMSCLQPAM